VTWQLTGRASVELVVNGMVVMMMMMMVMVVMMDHVRAGHGRNGDCGKNDESDQVAH
jgi:hypothetical protein